MSYLLKTHDNQTNNLISNVTLSYEIVKGVSVKTNMGFTDLKENEVIKNPIASRSPSSISALSTANGIFGTNTRSSWIVEPQIILSRSLGKHNIDVVIGSTWQGSNYKYESISGIGYSSDALLNSINAAPTKTYYNSDGVYRYNSGYFRVGYNFSQKYLLNLTGRRDGSSRFGPGNRYGNFGAIGAGWIFSKENVLVDNSVLSFGKLRGSYGIAGNDQIGDYKISQFFCYSG